MDILIGLGKDQNPYSELSRLTQGLSNEVACNYNFVKELPVKLKKLKTPFVTIRNENILPNNEIRKKHEQKTNLPDIRYRREAEQKYGTPYPKFLKNKEEFFGSEKTMLRDINQINILSKKSQITFQALLEIPLNSEKINFSNRNGVYRSSISLIPAKMNRSLNQNTFKRIKPSHLYKFMGKKKPTFSVEKKRKNNNGVLGTISSKNFTNDGSKNKQYRLVKSSFCCEQKYHQENFEPAYSNEKIKTELSLQTVEEENPVDVEQRIEMQKHKEESYYSSKWIQLVDFLNSQESLSSLDQIGYYKDQKLTKHMSMMQHQNKSEKKVLSPVDTFLLDMLSALTIKVGTDVHFSENFIKKMNDLNKEI